MARLCPTCHAPITTNKYLCLNCGARLGLATAPESSDEVLSLKPGVEPPLLVKPGGDREPSNLNVDHGVSPAGNKARLSPRYGHLRRRTITLFALGMSLLLIVLCIIVWNFRYSSQSRLSVITPEQASVSVLPDESVLVGVTAGKEPPENLLWKIKESDAGEIVSLGATMVGKRLLFKARYHAPKTSGEYHLVAQSSSPQNISAEIIVHVGQRGSTGYRRDSVGPSFDCGKAKTQVENMICKDYNLIEEERQMATAYKAVLDVLPESDKQAFRRQHFEWFKNYSQTCNAIGVSGTANDLRTCISHYLTDHIRELKMRAR